MRQSRPQHILIATPFGENGKGGIDRMMDIIRQQAQNDLNDDIEIRFVTTRGTGIVLLSIVRYFIPSIFLLTYLRIAWPIDVFHINIVQRGSTIRKMMLSRLAQMMGVPYILHLHGSQYRDYWDSAGPILSKQIREIFEKAARVLVLGQPWAEYVGGKAPYAQIEILPNATVAPAQAREHRDREEPIGILFLGQIGARKGVPELLQALAQLNRSPAWRATLAGDGQVEAARRQVTDAGIAGLVDVIGWAGPAEVERLLAGSDILVLPSHHENLPLSVIEGMAYGLAVVATPVGAVTDIIIDGETGLLCPVGEPIALASALQRLLQDAPLRARLGRSARTFHAERLNATQYLSKLKATWRDVRCQPDPTAQPQAGSHA